MIKEKKENLERQYIMDFEAHFINKKLDINNSEEINYIKEIIKNVARLEIEEMGCELEGDEKEEENVIKLEFSNDLKENVMGTHEYIDIHELGFEYVIIKINIAKLLKELSSDDSETRKRVCFLCFHALFHEIQHERQRMLTTINISSKYSMLFAKEFALKTILENKFYEQENYDRFAVENDAKAVGLSQLIELMQLKDEEILDSRDEHKIGVMLYRYKGEALNEHGNQIFKFQDEIVREDLFEEVVLRGLMNEELLWRYPILKKEYKTKFYGGVERRSTLELIKGLEDEIAEISSIEQASDEEKNILINSIKEIYYQMIFRSMQNEIYFDAFKEALKNGGTNASGLINPLGANKEIKKLVVEKKKQKVLYELIEYMGKDGLEKLIRRNKKKFSK